MFPNVLQCSPILPALGLPHLTCEEDDMNDIVNEHFSDHKIPADIDCWDGACLFQSPALKAGKP